MILSNHRSFSQGKFKSNFIDSTDNAFDVSNWLATAYGFFPIVMPITEPATGIGLAGGLVFIHRNKKELAAGIKSPPSISAIGGAYTQNGTWGIFAFHQGIWKRDKFRYKGALGYVSANLKYYPEILPFGINFNLKGFFLMQELIVRVRNSNFFLGGNYSYFSSKSTFSFDRDLPIDSIQLDLGLSQIGPVLVYDSRDNTFTPNTGMFFKAIYSWYDSLIGSDLNYSLLTTYWLGFSNRINKMVIGLRADARFAFGDTPYFSKPYIMLRGIPIMRYQGDQVYVLETEERWDIIKRWSLVGFAGIGNAVTFKKNTVNGDSNFSEWAYSLGGGFRYKIASKFGIYTGIDIAKGPEEWAFYIQFGHYWNSLR